jgi:hypothetical protein
VCRLCRRCADPEPGSISTFSLPQVKSLGRGCYGEAMLMREKATGELVAVKYIEKRKVGVCSEQDVAAAAVLLVCWLTSSAA